MRGLFAQQTFGYIPFDSALINVLRLIQEIKVYFSDQLESRIQYAGSNVRVEDIFTPQFLFTYKEAKTQNPDTQLSELVRITLEKIRIAAGKYLPDEVRESMEERIRLIEQEAINIKQPSDDSTLLRCYIPIMR